MTWRTHLLAGMGTVWLLSTVPHSVTLTADPGNVGLLTVAAGIGALLPDLDAAESKIKHLRLVGNLEPFALPALLIHRTFGHRGLLHSALGLVLFSLLVGCPVALGLAWPPALAGVLGYASHLALDACTRHGIPLWYPKRQRYHLLPPQLRFVTGSLAEEVLLPLVALPVLLLLFSALSGGFGGAV